MAVRALGVMVFALVVVGCGSDEPPWEWEVQAPAAMGMDSTVLDGARTYAFQEGKNTQGVVVTRRGVLVAEWYMDGADATSYGASWSVGKSFASALVGIAIERGDISGVDAPLADYYPSWKGTSHDQINVEHVLHMATGLKWSEIYDISQIDESDVAQIVLTTSSPLDYVVERPVEAPVNTVFNYSSGDSLLLSGILQQETGMSAGEYARKHLFSKLDMESAEWWDAKTGETLTYCCLDMTTRDFARFGLLYMNRGEWNGRQIVPAEWVDASLAPSSVYEGYGYKWWLTGRTNSGLPADTYSARGHDGQYIYVIPSLELVVVRNGYYYKDLGPPIADPTLYLRYPSGGLTPGGGTMPPDSWDDVAFLKPIIDSIVD
jgi:CubicO group peptidase (beta-lactamase class C family)